MSLLPHVQVNVDWLTPLKTPCSIAAVPISESLVGPMAPSADPLPRSWVVPSPPTQQTAAAADHNLIHRWTVPLGSIAGIPIRLHGD